MKNVFSILVLFIVNFSFAQKNVVASGGKAIGSSGTASYSIGLVSFKSPEGNSISDGMQQPYEILTLGNSDFTSIELSMKAYPNPTVDELVLKMALQNLSGYSFQLNDAAGKLLSTGKINLEESYINMKEYNAGIYFLDVKSTDKKIKTFKIIKK
ncbi:MAG: hypothetical protein RIQ59_507 [Bacteroidota bacterium]|jgi:hypothetical protein